MTPTEVVYELAARVLKNKNRLKDGITNEAELRYCLGDPILEALCNTWGYNAKLEETVKLQREQLLPVSSFYLNVFCCSVLIINWGKPE